MKNVKLLNTLLAISLLATMLFIAGCDDDDEAPAELTLTGLTAGTIDLNTATSATGVPTGSDIVAEFSTDIDPASTSAITLTRDLDDTQYPATITVDGGTVTINPDDNFSTGTLFIVNFGTGLMSTGGRGLTEAVERNFTTEGTFAAPGAIAHWTFEDNADDIVGDFDAPESGIVDITYVDGRKADAGKAASFNGTTSIIEVPNGSDLSGDSDFTLSFWALPSSANDKTSGHFIIGNGGSAGFQFEIAGSYADAKLAATYSHNHPDGAGFTTEDTWIDAKGNLGWQGWTFSKDYEPSGGFAAVVKDKWTHFVVVYNAAEKTGTAYVNGEKAKEQDFDNWPDNDAKRFVTGMGYKGTPPTITNEMAFGFITSRASTQFDAEPWGNYESAASNHFQGLLDDVIIYHKPLTQAEITAMYNSGKP